MKITTKYILIGVFVIFALWVLSGILITWFIPSSDRGTFGDMFGAINALFSGLALFGIVISILIQQSELRLQQKELIETREEFKVNRLTNVLFKQIEYLNTIIENTKFIEGNISKTLDVLDIYWKSDEKNSFFEILERNYPHLNSLTTKVISILENFNTLLSNANIEKKEIIQIKNLFRQNINPFYTSLLLYDLETIKKTPSSDSSMQEIEKGLVELKLQRIKYVMEYGKEKI